ncbi:hypothetical protein KL864_33775 [Mycolicibacterium goodii]|uniref:hypothetical protein n=1 Tax=Mycolicibacterium goodii TaxID=134601 RepID=UPI001BDC516D|nr:hypothetical protein [Mycolicibacterium goodii]MBU8820836.1 hypothetical protein [Mycolicibacterium goodii]
MTSSVAGARTLWPVTTPTSRICSASKGPMISVSHWMRQAVDEVYRQWLPLPEDWTPEQIERFLDQTTQRLDRMAAEMTDSLAATAIAQWTEHHGHHPDYPTTVQLRQTALQTARETIVRQELYDQIPETPEEWTDFDPPLQQPRPASEVPWNQRWKDARYRSEPGEELEELAEMVWPAPRFSTMFRIKAAYLLIARIEDGLPVPDGPQHPLADELAPMVYDDLRDDGYPVK